MRSAMPLAGIAVLALWGCGGSSLVTGPGSGSLNGGSVVNSILAAPPGDSIIDAPAMVHQGAAVNVSVWTMVAGCYSPLSMGYAYGPALVTLTPYSQDTRGRGICAAFITEQPQTISVVFGTVGVDTVRAIGYVSSPGGKLTLGSVQRTVVVVP